MLLFRGNCQMQFCAEAAGKAGLPAAFASLASPVTLLRSPGAVPPLVSAMVAEAGVAEFLHTRELADQFLPPPTHPAPTALVVNLFHENRPLWLHERDGYAFYLDPEALAAAPALGRIMARHFRSIVPNPATYLDRLAGMLLLYREALPGVPLLVAGRMSHFPGLGPSPHSYLDGWGEASFTTGREFAAWVGTVPDAFFLDADRIMAGVAARTDAPVEAHFPFLRIRFGPEGKPSLSRDLEHAGSLWPALAEKIRQTLAAGRVDYAPEETVPAAWTRPFAPQALDAETLLGHLASGSNYRAARAVGQFFFQPDGDFTDLLVAAAPSMPVCHNLLHMVRAYGTLRPNPALAEWCEVHAATAADFFANGEAYRREYLEKIEALRQTVLAHRRV
uniref:Uncharacterized protein n=1 Tax=Desulfovibrio sp. U5L TaxID=596152 RepID=I2Q0Q9_9BACT